MENVNENPETEKILKETIEELISKMGFECSVEVKKKEENLICDIKSEESSFLIGQYGVNLQSLQHIARVLIRKKIQDKVNFILDVNSYRTEKDDSIFRLAKSMAEEAIRERKAIVLRPMSPYERRIVHMELSKNNQVTTESIGEGEERKIVIKPADLI